MTKLEIHWSFLSSVLRSFLTRINRALFIHKSNVRFKTILPSITFGVAFLLSGCTLPRYIEAAPQLSNPKPLSKSSSVAILFHPLFPGKPLDETVVDNAIGAFWNPEEARKIGFTQNYAETLTTQAPQIAMLATLPTNVRVGMTASGKSGGLNIASRIMVPVGKYIIANTSELLRSSTEKYLVCLDVPCMDQARASGAYDRYVAVNIQRFRVAEEQMNRLTLETEAQLEISTPHQPADSPETKVIRSVIKNRSITSEGGFHSDFLRVMNKIANEMSSDFADQLLRASNP
jgi:hypothetical protein